jgi:hypothetical protein
LGEDWRSLSSSICSFLYSPVTSSLLGPNILNTLYLSVSSGQKFSTFIPSFSYFIQRHNGYVTSLNPLSSKVEPYSTS